MVLSLVNCLRPVEQNIASAPKDAFKAPVTPCSHAFTMPKGVPARSTATRTPTVSQFMNAAHAGYVWSSKQPADLQPFTIDGKKLDHAHLCGMSANVFQTPGRQLIISFQGTTGGDNGFFRPHIATMQLVADMHMLATHSAAPATRHAASYTKDIIARAEKSASRHRTSS